MITGEIDFIYKEPYSGNEMRVTFLDSIIAYEFVMRDATTTGSGTIPISITNYLVESKHGDVLIIDPKHIIKVAR